MANGYDPMRGRWAPRGKGIGGPWAAGYEGMTGPWAPERYESYVPRVDRGRGQGMYESYLPSVGRGPAAGGEAVGPYAYRGGSRWTPGQWAPGKAAGDPWGQVEAGRKVGEMPPLSPPREAQGGGKRPEAGGYGGDWYGQFRGEHGGARPETVYGQRENPWERREGLAEALADLEWSQGFERMYGRAPGDDDWKAWWFHSRGGGNFGARERYRDVKKASNIEFKRMREQAETPRDERKLRQYRAWSGGKGYDQLWYEGALTPGSSRWESFVRDRGMTPEEYYLGPVKGPVDKGAGVEVNWPDQSGGMVGDESPGMEQNWPDQPGSFTPGGPFVPDWGWESEEQWPDQAGSMYMDDDYGFVPEGEQRPRPPLWVPPQVYWRL